MANPPHYIDVFLSPIRDNSMAQVAFVALLMLIAMDVLLGFGAACKDGAVRSAKMREGVWHKTGELGCVAIADVVDGMMLGGIDLGYGAPVTTGVIVLLCVNEVMSCLENLSKLDPELAGSAVFKLLEGSNKANAGGGNGTE